MLAGLTQAFKEEDGGGEWGGGRMETAWEPSESGQGWPGRGAELGEYQKVFGHRGLIPCPVKIPPREWRRQCQNQGTRYLAQQKGKMGERRGREKLLGLCRKPGMPVLCVFTEGTRSFCLESFDKGGRDRYFAFGSEGRFMREGRAYVCQGE